MTLNLGPSFATRTYGHGSMSAGRPRGERNAPSASPSPSNGPARPLELIRALELNEQQRLIAHVDGFREALEAVQAIPGPMEYPLDPDTSAALLLHRFLSEANARNTFFFVSGERYRPAWRSHAWVQCGNLNIDITGHALGARRATVVTSSRRWFEQFSITDKRHRIYADYEDRVVCGRLDAIYHRVSVVIRCKRPTAGSAGRAAA